ncbi:hypothetical protein CCMA1212_010427 [Trichoderma ghanense]|uniref:Uncharacterized protein n=1 Tax=Trichoderma ghanense TaxID=65468 RepID=A0ABY2GPN7_9HYPO
MPVRPSIQPSLYEYIVGLQHLNLRASVRHNFHGNITVAENMAASMAICNQVRDPLVMYNVYNGFAGCENVVYCVNDNFLPQYSQIVNDDRPHKLTDRSSGDPTNWPLYPRDVFSPRQSLVKATVTPSSVNKPCVWPNARRPKEASGRHENQLNEPSTLNHACLISCQSAMRSYKRHNTAKAADNRVDGRPGEQMTVKIRLTCPPDLAGSVRAGVIP